MPTSDVAIRVRGVTKSFGSGEARVEALRGVDLEIPSGQFVAVMGQSGSGKSTLLHLLGGLDYPTSGTISIEGHDLSSLDDDALTLLRRRRIGFIFQAFNLLEVLSAEENVALPLVIDGESNAVAVARARECLELVGISHRRSHRPTEMSGGEQQRVAIARALVTQPLVIFADEPTGNLDSQNGDQIMALLRRLVDEKKQTVFMVTHDPRHAALADRLIVLRDGRVANEQRPSQAMRTGEDSSLSNLHENG
ncbi:ABC transporter ATP-binding protein [bacterium]|nr:ABC transporter ATP-binding protein [bacterium]